MEFSVSGSRQSAPSDTLGWSWFTRIADREEFVGDSMSEKLTLILAGIVLFGLYCMFLIDNIALWLRPRGGTNDDMIAPENYARANWWCPARRNRIATTGISGFNLSIFPIKTQWKQAFIAWLFPNYFWLTLGRHGKCLGSGCAVWRWHESRQTGHGWCGLAPKPDSSSWKPRRKVGAASTT